MHEYLYGELVCEAKLKPDPKSYIQNSYHDFAQFDAMIANSAGISGAVQNSVLKVIKHRQFLQHVEISDDEVERLLAK